MRLGNLNLPNPVLAAPLAGVSNRPFRLLAKRGGAALVYTEMVSSEGLIREHRKTFDLARFGPDERPIGVQLFGARPEAMGQAVAIVIDVLAPDLIDLNFGCPVRKVVGHNGGAAVLKDLGLTEAIIRAAVESAGETPVTIKIRTGWDEQSPVYEQVGAIAERAGCAGITLHARSRSRGFAGSADWSAIARLKQTVGIPVIGNGDVRTPEDAARMIETTGCDGVMIGRASMGDPNVFGRVAKYLAEGLRTPDPTPAEKVAMALEHMRLIVAQYGQPRGVYMSRKVLAWYVRGFDGASGLRRALFQVDTLADAEAVLKGYRATGQESGETSSDHAA